MKKRNAYFTVEASLVLPMVIGTLIFAVYLLLFQYNRCLLEQDAGMLAMHGSVSEGEDEALVLELQNRMAHMDEGKYLAWEKTVYDVKVQKNTCVVTAAGQVVFPIPRWNFWNDENVWSAETEWSFQNVYPVEFVRMCNKWRE